MVKIVLFFLPAVIFLGVFLNGCTAQICSTPYVLSVDGCCLDRNKDAVCDTQQDLFTQEEEEPIFQIPVKENAGLVSSSPQQEGQRTTKEGVILRVSEDDDPFKGNKDADVLLIEFGDYLSDGSKRFHDAILPSLLEMYGTKIKYVFRNFPDLSNERSLLAAQVSECAREQGKFWEYHDLLFAHANRLSKSSLSTYAADVGLQVDRFDLCVLSGKYKEEILKDYKDGRDAGAVFLPTFFINNKKFNGYQPLEKFTALFEEIFYEDIQAERGKTLTGRSIGTVYQILEGPAALEPDVLQSPYSNKLARADATFTVTARDKTLEDSSTSQDTAQLEVVYTLRGQDRLAKGDTYRLVLKQLLTEGVGHSFYGGVGIDVPVNGNSGVGTHFLPRSQAYVTLWGLADVFKNDDLVASDMFMHFMITTGIRDAKNQLMSKDDAADIEAYLLVSGKYKDQLLPGIDVGFLYLFWPELNIKVS